MPLTFIIDIREKAKRMKIVKTYDDEKLNNLLKVNLYPYQKRASALLQRQERLSLPTRWVSERQSKL